MPVKKRKTRTASKRRTSDRKGNREIATLISNVIAIFLAIFVAISNFSMGGAIGDIIRSIVLSSFGTLGYLLPIILVIIVIINLVDSSKERKAKVYSLILLYIAIISIFTVKLWNFEADEYSKIVGESITRARNYFSFTTDTFSGGAISTSIVYILRKTMGELGTVIFSIMVAVVTGIIVLGFSISRRIIKLFLAIVLFLPNVIKGLIVKREEDLQIAVDNERILKETIEKTRKKNLQVTFDRGFRGERLVLEPITEKSTPADKSKVDVTTEDVQSRFAEIDVENHNIARPQSHLLKEMKKKSINEIIYEEKEKGNEKSEFFITDGMKSIDDLENVILPKPHIEKNDKYDMLKNSYDDTDSDSIYNSDVKGFASGLESLRSESVIDKNDTSKTRENVEREGITLKNDSVRNTDILEIKKKKQKKYRFPAISLLNRNDKRAIEKDPHLNEKAKILVETLKQFGVGTTLLNITVGPAITRYELKPDIGVKVSKILSLENDVQLALAASSLKIEAPIPGKAAIGIEIANEKSSGVLLGDIISTSDFRNAASKLTVAIGKDISGKAIITDLRKMPHLLIAGATGSGKSVCVNSIITSLIYKSAPEDVRMILVDPKMVELQIYDGIPHLLIPVVTDPKKAASALQWAVAEMTRRYNLIQEKRVRDIESYNQVIANELRTINVNDENGHDSIPDKLPYIVIIIDEFADLMMVASKDVENSITRIAQLARACGIYLVIATQRPSVNVISGSIKTNVPSRISFAVASGIDSQTILDRRGAEKLLGRGDMLYLPVGTPEPIRVQGAFVTEEEILNIVSFVKEDDIIYDESAKNMIEKGIVPNSINSSEVSAEDRDDKFIDAGRLIIEEGNASIGMIQRKFAMGFNRAARIIDQLESEGVISKQDGKKPREVLMTLAEFNDKFGG